MQTITRKTLLYKSGVEYADFCLNHVEGCAHGCRFPCYALLMKKRCGVIKSYGEWMQPKIVENAMELLEKEIPKFKHKIKFVHLCFATDPFMYNYPEVSNLSLEIIERLNRDHIRCTVLTKGIYPEVLANTDKYGENNEYGITLVSLDKEFKKKFEPHSAPYKKRFQSLKYLKSKGLKTWVSMEPYPTPIFVKQNLPDILQEISFADKIIFGKQNYNKESTRYKNGKAFYQKCVEIITEFCNTHEIEHHIKFGTQEKDNEKTGELFYEVNS